MRKESVFLRRLLMIQKILVSDDLSINPNMRCDMVLQIVVTMLDDLDDWFINIRNIELWRDLGEESLVGDVEVSGKGEKEEEGSGGIILQEEESGYKKPYSDKEVIGRK